MSGVWNFTLNQIQFRPFTTRVFFNPQSALTLVLSKDKRAEAVRVIVRIISRVIVRSIVHID